MDGEWKHIKGQGLVFQTKTGSFMKETTHKGTYINMYKVEKLDGSWPDKEELGIWCDYRYDMFGGEVVFKAPNFAIVSVFIR